MTVSNDAVAAENDLFDGVADEAILAPAAVELTPAATAPNAETPTPESTGLVTEDVISMVDIATTSDAAAAATSLG